jgi:hypothetical protein
METAQPYWKEWLRNRIAEQNSDRSEQLDRARSEARITGKEPFDRDKLGGMIDLRSCGSGNGWEIDPDDIESCEFRYYVMHPQFKTLREFAEFVEVMNISSAALRALQ